ncbi:ulp1 protease family, C-terminal catalytic domain-containing protein [Tanacetum coccineum]
MSPSHLKNVLDSLTTQQVSVLEELGLGEYHNNFNFTSTPGKLGLWIVNNYDHEEHTIKMVDGRKIKVTRELIHEILGVPMGEIKVNALLNITSEDETTTDWRRSTEFTEERINISKLDNHVCSLTETGWNFKVGFLVIFFSILAQGNKDGTVNQRFIPALQYIDQFKNYDWCKYILDCIQEEIMEFKPKNNFSGPLVLLALIYCSSIVSPTTVVERKAPIFKHWSLELIEKPKKNLKKKKSKQNILEIGSMSREEELEQFKSKTVQIKALLLDTDDKIKIALDENPEDIDLKMIIEKRLAFFKELNHRDDHNAMVVLDNGNNVPEQSVKDNEVSNEKDDVTEKQKDEINREKDAENVVYQDVDKLEDVEKESEFGNDENHNDSENKEVEKNTEDLIKRTVVCVGISKKEVSKRVLAINEDTLKDSQSETLIIDIQPKDSQHEAQDSQSGMEKGAEIQEDILETVKNCETLKESDFPSTGLEDIESLKGGRRNLFNEKSTVQNVNEDDMILQESLLNLPFLSTQEVSCLDIDTKNTPQIQKQCLQEESSQIQKHEIPKSFHSNKLKLAKYVLPDAQATGKKRQEVMVNETSMFRGRETKTFDSIKSKLVKKNDGIAECMKEKPIYELKGKSVNFKGGHPTAKRQQIKKAMEGEKNVPKTRGKKTDADKQDIKKPQVRKQTAAQLAKSKETKATTVKPAPTKRKKKEPNDKEETAIYASPISFIPPPIDTESEKRQGKPSNFLVSPFYQRKVILDEPVSEEGKKIVEYIWSKNTPEGKKGFGIEGVYFLSLYPEIEVASTIIDLWTLVLNNEEQHRDKLSGDGNVYCHTVMMTQHSVEMGKDLVARRESFDENINIVLKQAKRKNFDDVNLVFFPTIKTSKKSNHFYVICFNLKTSEIDIIDNIDNAIDDIKTRYGGFPCALMESFIDYLERKKHQNCYDLILAEPKIVEFPWKTTYNSHDCGVFVMRHMETYLGKGNFLQEFKKEGPGQKVQLNMLRAKYMVKILLMSFNEKKKTLLKQAQEYIKMKPKRSKVLTGNDVRVDEELFKQFNETVIKTIDV